MWAYRWYSKDLIQPTDAVTLEDPLLFRTYAKKQWRAHGSADAKLFGSEASKFFGTTLDYVSRQPIFSIASSSGNAQYGGTGGGIAVVYKYTDLPFVDEFRQYKGHEDIWMYRCRTTIGDTYFYGWLWFVDNPEANNR
jgi:hypothetical protein